MYSIFQRLKLYFKGYNQEIFISYAWNDKDNKIKDRERIVDDLCKALISEGFLIIRDKTSVRYRDLFSALTDRIGSGKFIIIIISDKYLKSEHCMSELLAIYWKCNRNVLNLKDKIFPIVLEDVDIYKPSHRIKYFKYWEDEARKLELSSVDCSPWQIPKTLESVRLYKEIASHMDYFLDLLSNMNTLNVKLLSEGNFKEIKNAIVKKNLQESYPGKQKRSRKRIAITVSVALSFSAPVFINNYFSKSDTITNKTISQNLDSNHSPPNISTQPNTPIEQSNEVTPSPSLKKNFLNIQGMVLDEDTGYPIDSAVVWINNVEKVTKKGFYEVNIPVISNMQKGYEINIVCKFYKDGYESKIENITFFINKNYKARTLDDVRLYKIK